MTEKQTPQDSAPQKEQPYDFLKEEALARTPTTEFLPQDLPEDLLPTPPSDFKPHAEAARNFIDATPPEAKAPAPSFLDETDVALDLGNSSKASNRDSFEAYAAQRAEASNFLGENEDAKFEVQQTRQPITKEIPVKKPEATSSNKGFLKKVAVGALGIAAGATAVVAGAQHFESSAPEFSEKTTTYTVEPGDGIFDAAETIKGVETVDIRKAVEEIKNDPANATVLEDGLQPNEQLVIPTAVEGHENDK